MAKDLVRTRRYAQKFQGMKAQLQAVSLRIQVIYKNICLFNSRSGEIINR